MKYYSVLIFLMCAVAAFGQTYIGIGRIVPGQNVLGFADNSTVVTSTPQSHSVRLHFHGTPGNNITFVHVNVFPGWSSFSYPTLGQFDDFWIDVALSSTTQLGANIIVYGFNATSSTRTVFKEPIENPKMVTIMNVENSD
ncbi:uncharacterized protein LOC129799950 [Phlebotomus papatasi]|uniref:uncharacterized protein LOC129799950 n=1 Tax=Phlebotomus papatasi TaxID=29031 RepID=UPI002483A03A|nr:uncharacterized protein LOC129799950 [Phlebotomus papatasi]